MLGHVVSWLQPLRESQRRAWSGSGVRRIRVLALVYPAVPEAGSGAQGAGTGHQPNIGIRSIRMDHSITPLRSAHWALGV